MSHTGRVSVSLGLFLRNRRSRGNPPRRFAAPLQGGEQNIPSREGWPKAGVGSLPSRQTTPSASPITHFTRFLACRRGVVALESALAAIPLVFCLAGVFEIVQIVFVRDLLQRTAYRTAYANSLYESAASDATAFREQWLEAITTEVGGFLSFALAEEDGSCTPSQDGKNAADFCVQVTVIVYDTPTDMLNDQQSQGSNAGLGGDAGDMVVVTVVAKSQSVLSELQQGFFGTEGLTVTAVRRNERAVGAT